MSRRIGSIQLDLPKSWHWIPQVGRAGDRWAAEMAERLLPEPLRDEDALAVLAEQLGDVYSNVEESGAPDAWTAVCAPPPAYVLLSGMIMFQASSTASLDSYSMALAEWTNAENSGEVRSADPIDEVLPAGRVKGAHVILNRPVVAPSGIVEQVLEERVVLALEPPGCDNVLEIVCIAASLGSFKDMTRDMLELLRPLVVLTKEG